MIAPLPSCPVVDNKQTNTEGLECFEAMKDYDGLDEKSRLCSLALRSVVVR